MLRAGFVLGHSMSPSQVGIQAGIRVAARAPGRAGRRSTWPRPLRMATHCDSEPPRRPPEGSPGPPSRRLRPARCPTGASGPRGGFTIAFRDQIGAAAPGRWPATPRRPAPPLEFRAKSPTQKQAAATQAARCRQAPRQDKPRPPRPARVRLRLRGTRRSPPHLAHSEILQSYYITLYWPLIMHRKIHAGVVIARRRWRCRR